MPVAAFDEGPSQPADQILPPSMGSQLCVLDEVVRLVQAPVTHRGLGLSHSQEQHGFCPQYTISWENRPSSCTPIEKA
jgi:hypothetical protein